jgi:hypothetical protein
MISSSKVVVLQRVDRDYSYQSPKGPGENQASELRVRGCVQCLRTSRGKPVIISASARLELSDVVVVLSPATEWSITSNYLSFVRRHHPGSH